MAILDVQAMVKHPQERLEAKSSIESRSQNLAEKKNSFSQHLKTMSRRELESETRTPVRKEIPPKNTSLERLTFEQKADSTVDSVDANGKLEKQMPVQEKLNSQDKTDSKDEKITEANQSVLSGVENASTQELEKQSQDEDNELTTTSMALVQPQLDLTVTPDSEESKTASVAEIATVPVQVAAKQLEGQNQEPLVAVLDTAQAQVIENQTPGQVETNQPFVVPVEAIQPQLAEKTDQVLVEPISPVSETVPVLSQAETNETVPVSNNQENVQEGQGKANRSDAKASLITLITDENQGEATASSSSTQVTVKISPQGETLSVPENQAMDTETEEMAAQPTLLVPGNPATLTDNVILAEDPEQLAEKISATPTLVGNTGATVLEDETAKKAIKASDKDRMKLKLVEKPLGDLVNKKTEEPTAKDVKKIMELENHRLANSKIPDEAPLLEEAAQETGGEEGKNLTLLDKTLVELAKPSSEVGKAQSSNSARPAVSPEELMEQIVKKVELVSNKQTGSEMRIQLKPEFLGKMMIQIIVDDGLVTARFTTESQHVKQVLEANMNSLKQTLEANGMRVEKTEVNVQLDNGGNFNNNSEGNRQQLWQEMSSQGRNSNHYNSFNNGYGAEVEDLNPYQREADTPSFIDEGRVDYII